MKIPIEVQADVRVVPIMADGAGSSDMVGQARIVVITWDPGVDKTLSHNGVGGASKLIFLIERSVR